MYGEPFTHRRPALTAVAPVCVREFSPLSFVCVVFSIFYKERKGKAAAARRPARGPTPAAPDARAPGRAPCRAPTPAARPPVFQISRDRSRSRIKSCNPKNQIWDLSRNKWYLSQI